MLRLIARAFAILLVLNGSTAASVDTAPFRDLVDINGKAVTTEANVGTGQWQIVMIWATDCHVCAEMKPLLSQFHEKHKDDNAVVYGIALDGVDRLDAVQRYMLDHKVSFPTFVGELELIALNFEINAEVRLSGTPTYMLFNPDGELIAIDYGMLEIDSLERFIARNS